MEVKVTEPLLPLRDIVVFPSMVIPLFVGRDKSITALNEVMKGDKKIVLVTQKNSEVDDPKKNDVFSYGCESNILQLLKLVAIKSASWQLMFDLISSESDLNLSCSWRSDLGSVLL